MPARIGAFDNPVLGYLGFCGVKFVGYSLAALVISRYAYPQCKRNAFAIGATRTLIGVAGGAMNFFLLRPFPGHGDSGLSQFFAGLFVVRLIEWWLVIWLFYDRRFEHKGRGWKVALLGTAWSFACDFPAIIGYFMTGGMLIFC